MPAMPNANRVHASVLTTPPSSGKAIQQCQSELLELGQAPTIKVQQASPLSCTTERDVLITSAASSSTGRTVRTTDGYGSTKTTAGTAVAKSDSPRNVYAKKRVIVSAIANLSTAYNLAVINYALMMIRQTYPPSSPKLTSAVVSFSLCGAIVGQLTFGYIGDAIGRKKGMILTLMLTIVGALTSALLPWGPDSIYQILALSRFVLGLGVGGVYPLSATTAAEASHDDVQNSKVVAAVFSFQGCGQLLAPLLTYVLLWLGVHAAIGWRILLAAGALPGLFVLHQAFEAHESSEFSARRMSGADSMHRSLFDMLRQDTKLCRKLIGASLGWFLFDITFYGNVIFTPVILEDTYALDSHHLPDVALYSVVVALIALPGYYATVWAVGRVTFKTIQMQGFVVMAILFFILGAFYTPLLQFKALLLGLYAATFFFSNFGPNVSTFCLPAEIFPPDIRVKLNGISAACGKIGATVGAAFFGVIEQDAGVEYVLVLSAFISLFGALVTHRYIQSKHYSHH